MKTNKTEFAGLRPFTFSGPASRAKGFALVISLSLMVMLTILAVGLLTLSTVSLRSSSRGDAQQIARSNARLGLALALGQLQKNAGGDRRITAPANIEDENAPPWLTGVWNGKLPTSTAPAPPKDDEFLGYLVSGMEEQRASPSSQPDLKGGAELMGQGSLGGDASAADRVYATKVGTPSSVGTSPGGRYAWAVLDEGVKAKVDLVRDSRGDLANGARQAAVGAPSRFGLEAVDGLDGFKWFEENSQGRMFTYQSGDLIENTVIPQVGHDNAQALIPRSLPLVFG